MIQRIIIALFLSAITLRASSQLDTLTDHLSKMYAFYDSARSLAFDVRFVYGSDTVLSNFIHRENDGMFIMDRNRFYYRYDNVECLQSDSFQITVMQPEQLIMVAPSSEIQSGGMIPLKEKIDSLISIGFDGYSYTINKTDSVNTMEFTAGSSSAEFQRFALHYDPISFALIQYELQFYYDVPIYEEGEELVGDELLRPSSGDPRLLTLNIYFLHYRIANIDEDLFDEDRFILSDGRGQWKAAGKYEGYTVHKMFN